MNVEKRIRHAFERVKKVQEDLPGYEEAERGQYGEIYA